MKLIVQIAAGILLAAVIALTAQRLYVFGSQQVQETREADAASRLSNLNIDRVRDLCKPISEKAEDVAGPDKWYSMEILTVRSFKFANLLLVPDSSHHYYVNSLQGDGFPETFSKVKIAEELPCLERATTASK